jgi:2-C-methyl-D-erythritol 4-phosphate cytidylyltransferase
MKRAAAAAVIVAGGQGKRFGSKVPKQYLTLRGRPVLQWSLAAFDQTPGIGMIVLVVPAADVLRARRQVGRWKLQTPITVVAGGTTRSESVRQGVEAVPAGFGWIAVHDAVRPLVTRELIENVLKAARTYKAAIAACPSRDTVKVSNSRQTIQRTLPRETVWLAQTPQAFERSLLERAHRRARRGVPTDDAQLVEQLGISVKLVEGPPENVKVTVPSDLRIADALLRGRT